MRNNDMRVETPLLSFIVSANAEACRVEFPFVVLLANDKNDNDKNSR